MFTFGLVEVQIPRLASLARDDRGGASLARTIILTRFATTLAMVLVAAAMPLAAHAQAGTYPAFQPSQIVDREYNLGVADAGGNGTSVVFQWREGWSPISQFSLDVGVHDPDLGNALILAGAGYARELARASDEMPLDLLFATGLYLAAGDGARISFPVGIVAGHRFPLEGNFALTPYIHPRVALDFFTSRGPDDDSDTDLSVAFDLGVNLEVTQQLSLRFGAVFGDDDGFGISGAWRPAGLR